MLDFVGTCICTQVSRMNMTHLCKETPVTVVNGQLPGPVIDVNEGDSVVVHVVNKSPYNITIHGNEISALIINPSFISSMHKGIPLPITVV